MEWPRQRQTGHSGATAEERAVWFGLCGYLDELSYLFNTHCFLAMPTGAPLSPFYRGSQDLQGLIG